jgi:hypothetical protein
LTHALHASVAAELHARALLLVLLLLLLLFLLHAALVFKLQR